MCVMCAFQLHTCPCPCCLHYSSTSKTLGQNDLGIAMPKCRPTSHWYRYLWVQVQVAVPLSMGYLCPSLAVLGLFLNAVGHQALTHTQPTANPTHQTHGLADVPMGFDKTSNPHGLGTTFEQCDWKIVLFAAYIHHK